VIEQLNKTINIGNGCILLHCTANSHRAVDALRIPSIWMQHIIVVCECNAALAVCMKCRIGSCVIILKNCIAECSSEKQVGVYGFAFVFLEKLDIDDSFDYL